MRLLLVSMPPAYVATVNAVRTRTNPCSEPVTPAAVTAAPICPVLEVSGTLVGTRITIDPAFDLLVRPALLSRVEATGNATLMAYNGQGQLIVSFPFSANGEYRLDVPLAPALAQSIRVLRVVTSAASAERIATIHGEAKAETVATDESTIVLAWNARDFPALRIAPEGSEGNVTYAAGDGTYQQILLRSPTRRLSVDFSDGVRSITRTFAVFGR